MAKTKEGQKAVRSAAVKKHGSPKKKLDKSFYESELELQPLELKARFDPGVAWSDLERERAKG